jgi:hypothetical protein
MTPLALFLLAARVTLFDEQATLRPGDWLWEEVRGSRAGVVVHCEIEQPPGGRARAALVPKRALERYRPGDRTQSLADASVEDGGRFHHRITDSLAYAVVVENLGPETAKVRVRIELEHDRTATELPPATRNILLAISAVLLAGIIGAAWAGWRKVRRVSIEDQAA